MERLSDQQEAEARRFHEILGRVAVIDDLFPPDEDGVHEPRKPVGPIVSGMGAASLLARV